MLNPLINPARKIDEQLTEIAEAISNDLQTNFMPESREGIQRFAATEKPLPSLISEVSATPVSFFLPRRNFVASKSTKPSCRNCGIFH